MGLQRNYQGKVDALDDLMRRYPNSQYIDDALYEKSRALVMMNREGEAINVLTAGLELSQQCLVEPGRHPVGSTLL